MKTVKYMYAIIPVSVNKHLIASRGSNNVQYAEGLFNPTLFQITRTPHPDKGVFYPFNRFIDTLWLE